MTKLFLLVAVATFGIVSSSGPFLPIDAPSMEKLLDLRWLLNALEGIKSTTPSPVTARPTRGNYRSTLNANLEPAAQSIPDNVYHKLEERIAHESRQQTLSLVEAYLQARSEDLDCMTFLYCDLATNPETEEYQMALSSISAFRDIIATLSKHNDYVVKQMEIPFSRFVLAFEFGSDFGSKDREFCKKLFPCTIDAFSQWRGRSTCQTTSKLCPGIIISCSLCGMFSPGTCHKVCTIAATSCGVATYSCMIAQNVKAPPKNSAKALWFSRSSNMKIGESRDGIN